MTFDTTTVHLHTFGVPPYLFFSSIGVAFATSVFILLLLKYGHDIPRYMKIFLLSGIGLLVGGKIFGWLAVLYATWGGDAFTYSGMGLVFYGGMIGFLSSFLLICKIWYKTIDYDIVDLAIVCFPLFHFWGRLACFFTGCCYGMESDSFFSMVYTNRIGGEIITASRIPMQLVEAGFNGILFIILLKLLQNKILRGRLAFVYLFSYAIARFLFEFFRADLDRGIWNGLSFSQFVSVMILALCLTLIVTIKSKKKTHE